MSAQSLNTINQKTREGCGCRKFLAGKVFGQFSTLLENSPPIFRQHKMISLPRFGHFPASKTAAGKLAAPSGTLLDFLLRDRHTAFLGRERKMRTNFLSTNFWNTHRGPGHPGKIPGTSEIPLFETQGRQTFEGEHEVFGHHPFARKTPTPPGGLRAQKVSLCALFACLIEFL